LLLLLLVRRRCRSTRDPPHEQWLVRLGAGGVSFGGGLSVSLVAQKRKKNKNKNLHMAQETSL
jgi:hypothetical protein